MEGRGAVLPFVCCCRTISSIYLHTCLVRPLVGELKTSGVDQAVDLVLLAIGDDTFLGDALDALAFGVD